LIICLKDLTFDINLKILMQKYGIFFSKQNSIQKKSKKKIIWKKHSLISITDFT